jgi:hypothetical protein
VVDVAFGGSSWGIVRPEDVIVSIDGQPVDRDGSVVLDGRFRVGATYLAQRKSVGQIIRFEAVREGKRIPLEIILKNPVSLVPVKLTGRPDYFIYGGFVFIPLTMNYLWEWGTKWQKDAPAGLVTEGEKNLPTPDRREVVILRSAMAHRINAGYQEAYNMAVASVDGKKIGDMNEFVSAIRSATGKDVVLAGKNGEKVVINRAKAAAAEAEILASNGIAHPASERFMKAGR